MSVVIGYVTDQFTILITNTRITFERNAEFGWDDDNKSLFLYQIWAGQQV